MMCIGTSVWVGKGQEPALPGQQVFLPPEGHLLWRTGQYPKHCQCCGEQRWVTVLWPFLFAVSSQWYFRLLNCRLCPTSVFTEVFLYLPVHFRCCRKETRSLLPIFPPASSCTSCTLCISKSHSWSSLGLPPPAGAPHLFLFPLAVSHLFQCLVTFWCQQLSLSARASWVLGGLIHSLYIHAPGSFWRGVSDPLSMRVCLERVCFPFPAAGCSPRHLAVSGVFYCVS